MQDRAPPSLPNALQDAQQQPDAANTPAQTVSVCEAYKYDTVIPLVYPMQPITIPLQAIQDGMNLAQWAVLSIPRSMEATFNRPNANPPLTIISSNDTQIRVTGLGHAGVVIINGETGVTRYFEYGRYGGPYGQVRERPVADVTMEDYCNPSSVSLTALARDLTRTNGGPYGFEAAYIKLPDGAYEQMEQFVLQRMSDVRARTAAEYDINSNHCFTFAVEVAASGGAQSDVSSAPDLDIQLRTRIGTSVDAPDDLNVELPSRQIQVLQRRYAPLSVGRDGSVPGDFVPPERP